MLVLLLAGEALAAVFSSRFDGMMGGISTRKGFSFNVAGCTRRRRRGGAITGARV